MSLLDAHLLNDLPLRVVGVEVQSPVLTLFGDEWSLTIACPWDGIVGGRKMSWEDDDIEDWAWDLIGEDLVTVEEHGSAVRFKFLNASLTAAPDSDLDPWVLSLPGGVLVGRTL